MNKLTNDIAEPKDDYVKDCLSLANAMDIPATTKEIDGDLLVFVASQFSSVQEQFIPALDMDQNAMVFNWLCRHGIVCFCGNEAQLVLDDQVFIVTGQREGLFRQQLIVDLAVKLANIYCTCDIQ